MNEIEIALPNGAWVCPKKLEARFPCLFTPECIRNIREAIDTDWELWQLPENRRSDLMMWATEKSRAHESSINYWLMICITGTADFFRINPIALFDVFEHIP